jgi:predicted SprT family Zn-dependent metalloprotease
MGRTEHKKQCEILKKGLKRLTECGRRHGWPCPPPIEFLPRPSVTFMGQYRWIANRIQLNPALVFSTEPQIYEVLLHEYAHYIAIKVQKMHKPYHGAHFKSICRTLGIPESMYCKIDNWLQCVGKAKQLYLSDKLQRSRLRLSQKKFHQFRSYYTLRQNNNDGFRQLANLLQGIETTERGNYVSLPVVVDCHNLSTWQNFCDEWLEWYGVDNSLTRLSRLLAQYEKAIDFSVAGDMIKYS